jgi:hypothetical protein
MIEDEEKLCIMRQEDDAYYLHNRLDKVCADDVMFYDNYSRLDSL